MPLPKPEPGLMIAYSYLWASQRTVGETEGRKTRPCAIVVATSDEDGDPLVYVAPVTHSKPADDEHAIELPAKLKRHLGLDDQPSWVVTTELNRFIWPGYDLKPIARNKPDTFVWGYLPTDIFNRIKQGIARNRQAQRLKVSDREI